MHFGRLHDLVIGQVCVVGIVTCHGLDGLGFELQWGQDFSGPIQTSPEAHPASCTVSTRSLTWEQSNWGMVLTTHPLLVQRLRMDWSYTSPSPLCLHRYGMGCPLPLYLVKFLWPALNSIQMLSKDTMNSPRKYGIHVFKFSPYNCKYGWRTVTVAVCIFPACSCKVASNGGI